jgi:hypothetical protein
MKNLYLFLLLLCSYNSLAQDAPIVNPRFLVMDTSLSMAAVFNAEVLKAAPGFHLLGSEKLPGQIISYTFIDGRDGSIRLDYKFYNESGKQRINYQSITADLEVIIPIFNSLFRTKMASTIDNAGQIGGTCIYKQHTYQYTMQADDYKAGYWTLSFIRTE